MSLFTIHSSQSSVINEPPCGLQWLMHGNDLADLDGNNKSSLDMSHPMSSVHDYLTSHERKGEYTRVLLSVLMRA